MADLLHLVDKPEGWTSHDAVARMRTILGERRVGHAGTLDPFATGLLVVGEGKATALLGCASLLPKRYHARARLGVATDTQDRTGVPIRTSSEIPGPGRIEETLARFRGRLMQRPPLYSAVKVRGERLYKAARRGRDVEREERPVHVYDLRLMEAPLPEASLPEIALDVTASRGTYIRSLAHDLGEALGCGAHLLSLRRVASGPFLVEDALTPDAASGMGAEAVRGRGLPLAQAIPHLPRVRLAAEEAARLRHGVPPGVDPSRVEPAPAPFPLPPGESAWPIGLLGPEGELLALAAAPPAMKLLRVLAAA
ncbi:MAG: tRNA pseudouridine(55) synthase TruB [Candidatus Latescibacteria bacterium]|nr:tRNA pseudouridine(55) synthase TruB [Candidatus Latescibacterota bacterium]